MLDCSAVSSRFETFRNSIPNLSGVPPGEFDDIQVTPLSKAGQDCWIFPPDWLPAGSRRRNRIYFAVDVKLPGGIVVSLRPPHLAGIRRSCKVATLAYLRHDIESTGRKRRTRPKPRTVIAFALRVIRLAAMAVSRGHQAFKLLEASEVVDIVQQLSRGNKLADSYTQTVGIINSLGRLGKLLDYFQKVPAPEDRVPSYDYDRTRLPGRREEGPIQPFADDYVLRRITLAKWYVEKLAPVLIPVFRNCYSLAKSPDYILGTGRTYSIPLQRARQSQIAAQHWPLFRGRPPFPWPPIAWPPTEWNEIRRLTRLLQGACADLIQFCIGLRSSELIGLNGRCVHPGEGESGPYIDFTEWKTAQSLHGKVRRLPVHPLVGIAVDRLREIAETVTGDPNGVLLVSLQASQLDTGEIVPAGVELSVTSRNLLLKDFDRIHCLRGDDLSSHCWRKTLAGLAVRVITGAPLIVKKILGHQSLEMTGRYILSSPFIRAELREMLANEHRRRGRTMIQATKAMGGPGLGGEYGRKIEMAYERFISDVAISEHDIDKTVDEFVEEMIRSGITPTIVGEGVICCKPPDVRAPCSRYSKDKHADPANCTATCLHQVQMPDRRSIILWTLRKMIGDPTVSKFLRSWYIGQVSAQLHAWPDLAAELDFDPSVWPELASVLTGRQGHAAE